LSGLTRGDDGVAVPKQYCSLDGGPTLVQLAVRRAQRVVAAGRIVVVVAAGHHRWWSTQLPSFVGSNLVVQPANRGTAAGVLYPLLRILRRDPDALVAVFPSDHHVTDEAVLCRAVDRALAVAEAVPRLVLLGLSGQPIDPGLGWIVPDEPAPFRGLSEATPGLPGRRGLRAVARFREKPSPDELAALAADGALVNLFLFAARGRALRELYRRRLPGLVEALERAIEPDPTVDFDARYETVPELDFSRDLLETALDSLAVLPVDPCGWSDLGTPARVAACLAARAARPLALPARRRSASGFGPAVDLSARLAPALPLA
jgi:mannose-1-phosphate guanylyltransferase